MRLWGRRGHQIKPEVKRSQNLFHAILLKLKLTGPNSKRPTSFEAFTQISFVIAFNVIFTKNRDRPIFGFHRYIGIGQNGRYYQPQ